MWGARGAAGARGARGLSALTIIKRTQGHTFAAGNNVLAGHLQRPPIGRAAGRSREQQAGDVLAGDAAAAPAKASRRSSRAAGQKSVAPTGRPASTCRLRMAPGSGAREMVFGAPIARPRAPLARPAESERAQPDQRRSSGLLRRAGRHSSTVRSKRVAHWRRLVAGPLRPLPLTPRPVAGTGLAQRGSRAGARPCQSSERSGCFPHIGPRRGGLSEAQCAR